MSLAQIPDLQLSIVTGREQVGAMGVEVDAVNEVIMGIIVLEEPVASIIEYLDLSVAPAATNAGAIGVELNVTDHTRVVGVGVDELVGLHIPESHCLVIARTINHARV